MKRALPPFVVLVCLYSNIYHTIFLNWRRQDELLHGLFWILPMILAHGKSLSQLRLLPAVSLASENCTNSYALWVVLPICHLLGGPIDNWSLNSQVLPCNDLIFAFDVVTVAAAATGCTERFTAWRVSSLSDSLGNLAGMDVPYLLVLDGRYVRNCHTFNQDKCRTHIISIPLHKKNALRSDCDCLFRLLCVVSSWNVRPPISFDVIYERGRFVLIFGMCFSIHTDGL